MASPAPSSLSSLSDYPADDGAVDIEDEAAMLDDLKAAYARGTPLFKKSALAAAAHALSANEPSVELEDVHGALRRHDVQYTLGSATPHIPLIHYNSYEALTNLAPYEHAARPDPLTIHWRAELPPPTCTLAAMEAAFQRHAAAWAAQSKRTTPSLTQLVAAARPQLGQCKVLCLGLGSPARSLNGAGSSDRGARNAEARCYTQHAAVLDIARALEAGAGPASSEAGGRVRVLAQDPLYSELDGEFLAGLGFEVVDDPQGFLELDDNSFVVSVACNVPQKQIVADLARPVAMLWDEVKGEEDDEKRWEKRPDDMWIAYVALCAGCLRER